MSKNQKKESPVKCMVIGDLHFRRNEVRAMEIVCEDILQKCKENPVDFIVCLGDTMHEHDIMRLDPFRRATSFLKKLGDIAPLYLLIGNHDIENNQINLQKIDKGARKHPFIDLFESENGSPITVIDEITKEEINGQDFCLTPFFPAGQYLSTLALLDIDVEGYTSFFSHQDWIGCKYTLDSEPSNFGDKWPKTASLNISGHIHEEQEIQSNLFLPGTPAPTRFGESNDKGIFLFTFYGKDNRTYEKLELPNTILRITKEFKVTERAEMTNYYKTESVKDLNRHLYRTIVVGSETEIKNFLRTELSKKLKRLGKLHTKFTNDEGIDFQMNAIGEDWTKQRNKMFSDLFFDYLTESENAEFKEIEGTMKKIFIK